MAPRIAETPAPIYSATDAAMPSSPASSIVKRNLGSALRARTATRRGREMLLQALTHNIVLARAPAEVRDRAGRARLLLIDQSN